MTKVTSFMCERNRLKETKICHIYCDRRKLARFSSSQLRRKPSRLVKTEPTTLSVFTKCRQPGEKTKTAAISAQTHMTSTSCTKSSVVQSQTAKHSVAHAETASPQQSTPTNRRRTCCFTSSADTGIDRTVRALPANAHKRRGLLIGNGLK